MKQLHSRAQTRKSGFTLIEILVVLAIAAIVSSIVFAAFKSIGEGNKKTSCQGNMVQIYQALRLYGQDFNGEFPSYNVHTVGATTNSVGARASAGLGLWALYAYPKYVATGNNLDCDGLTTQLPPTESSDNNQAPLASYIKSPRVFHCPYDQFEKPVVTTGTECNATAGTKLKTDVVTYIDKDGASRFNPFYNSYQTPDDFPAGGSLRDLAPYSSFRTSDSSRQLVYWKAGSPDIINTQRRTPDTTVVLWCRFHRKMTSDGATVDSASNSDNVLFMDGTVRYLPTKQPIGTLNCTGWQRIPEETIEGYNSTNPTACPQ